MQGQLVEGGALTYILITPDGYDPEASYPLIVLLHGFGASMYDLAGVAPAINSSGYIACPNAPYEVDLGGGVGYSWSRGRPGMPDLANIEGPTPEQRLAGFMGEVTTAARTEPRAGLRPRGGLT